MVPFKKNLTYVLILALLLAVLLIGRPFVHFFNAKIHDKGQLPGIPKGYADDISRLNKTKVDSIVAILPGKEAGYAQLKELLRYARNHKITISIAGAKHSMGGHTITPDGVIINMLPFKKMTLNLTTQLLTVEAGAMWADIIPYLDRYKRAVSIMQSDNSFSVGGSVSVNCHGWQHNKPPISSSVISFRLMNANGEIMNCSRKENQELFSLALGGYGLFGIILEVDLMTVPNEAYRYNRILMSSEKYLEYYSKFINANQQVKMVYGRLNVNNENFLEQAMLNFFILDTTDSNIPGLGDSEFSELKRSVFLGSKDDDYGKELRWSSEKVATKIGIGKKYSRNQVMNESPAFYLNTTPDKTDILHEYFIPLKNFNKFINSLKKIIPKYKCDLLNVTIRNVYKDEDSYLRYAHEQVFGFVMFFNQSITKVAEQEMENMTKELIDAALELDGTYYLPYRLHASKEQFERAYPMALTFFEKKRTYDPEEIFQNKFYQKYGSKNINVSVQ